MSLLIDDTDMPESCMECFCLEAFDDEIYGRQLFCGLLGADALAREHSRHKKCPLSEIPTPHGRLIDADRLIVALKNSVYANAFFRAPILTVSQIEQLIEHQPTIIEVDVSL